MQNLTDVVGGFGRPVASLGPGLKKLVEDFRCHVLKELRVDMIPGVLVRLYPLASTAGASRWSDLEGRADLSENVPQTTHVLAEGLVSLSGFEVVAERREKSGQEESALSRRVSGANFVINF